MPTRLRATIADYRTQCRTRNLDAQTIRWYTQKLTTIVDGLEAEGVMTVEDLSVPRLNGVMADLKNGQRSDLTLKGYHQVLLGWLTYLEDEELVGPSIRRRMVKNKPQVESRLIKTLPADAFDALYAATRHESVPWLIHRDRAILRVLIETGIRAAELCGLIRGDTYIEDDPHVKVFGKRKKEREVGPLSAECCRDISRYLRSQPRANGDILFLNRYHQPLTVSGLDQMLYRLRDWAGLDRNQVEVRAHVFRHTFAFSRIQQGMDIYRLSLLMGHGDTKTTEVYLREFRARQARQQVRA